MDLGAGQRARTQLRGRRGRRLAWLADCCFNLRNEHAFFGMLLHHPLHPFSTSERLLVLLLQLMCASPRRAAAASARPPSRPRPLAPPRPLCAEWPRYVADTRPSLHVFEKRMLYNDDEGETPPRWAGDLWKYVLAPLQLAVLAQVLPAMTPPLPPKAQALVSQPCNIPVARHTP